MKRVNKIVLTASEYDTLDKAYAILDDIVDILGEESTIGNGGFNFADMLNIVDVIEDIMDSMTDATDGYELEVY